MVEMRLQSLKINDTGDRQYIGLSEVDGARELTIVIGYSEVQAIDRFVKDVRPPRPMTHELVSNLIEATGCRIELQPIPVGTGMHQADAAGDAHDGDHHHHLHQGESIANTRHGWHRP